MNNQNTPRVSARGVFQLTTLWNSAALSSAGMMLSPSSPSANCWHSIWHRCRHFVQSFFNFFVFLWKIRKQGVILRTKLALEIWQYAQKELDFSRLRHHNHPRARLSMVRKDGWVGLRHSTRNRAWQRCHRGFESHSFRWEIPADAGIFLCRFFPKYL